MFQTLEKAEGRTLHGVARPGTDVGREQGSPSMTKKVYHNLLKKGGSLSKHNNHGRTQVGAKKSVG